MTRRLAVLALALTLSGTPAHAAKKPKPPPVAAEVLAPHQTPLEQWCAYFGMLSAAIAVDRDRQEPLTTTRARLRRILAADLKALPEAARTPLIDQMAGVASIIYADPSTPPKHVRFVFERGCVDAGTVPPVMTPAQQPWR